MNNTIYYDLRFRTTTDANSCTTASYLYSLRARAFSDFIRLCSVDDRRRVRRARSKDGAGSYGG